MYVYQKAISHPRFEEFSMWSFLNNEKVYKLSVSVGYSPYNEKYSKTIDDMIRYADEKMYKDKKRKK